MNGFDLVPDECSDYWEDCLQFSRMMRGMKVTHKWCPETKRMQPLEYFKAKLDNELCELYTDFGGEA